MQTVHQEWDTSIVYIHTKEDWTAGKRNNLELYASTYRLQNRLKKKSKLMKDIYNAIL